MRARLRVLCNVIPPRLHGISIMIMSKGCVYGYCTVKAPGRVLKSKLRCAIYDYVTDTIPGEVGCGHCGTAEGNQSFIAVIRVRK